MSAHLTELSPVGQLRAGQLPRRLAQLFVGLGLYGVSMAMMIRADLGLDPWDVFHTGVAGRVQVSFGTVVIVVGLLVLLAWIPLRQWPGLGTISNVFVIGIVSDVALSMISTPGSLPARIALLLGGIALNGLAGAMYIGSQFGPGPRDGLMTGLVRRTGRSVRVVRTVLELTVLAVGWLLGGVVGVGTVLYALLIGQIVGLLLPRLTVRLAPPAPDDQAAPDQAAPDQAGAGPGGQAGTVGSVLSAAAKRASAGLSSTISPPR